MKKKKKRGLETGAVKNARIMGASLIRYTPPP